MLVQAANPRSGQVGVITLLIMAVLLTVGLSTAANINRDVEISRAESESTRVFNAAEAGIEQALSQGIGFSGSSTGGNLNYSNVDVNYTIDKVRSLETRLFEGVSVAVNVTGSSDGNGLAINWSREDDCGTQDPASLLIAIYSKSSGQSAARFLTAGACTNRNDNFTAASVGNYDEYRRRITIPLQTGDVQVRIKPIYNDTHLRVQGANWTLPVQGVLIRSQASNLQGRETRAVEVNRSLSTAPSIFDYTVVSGTAIAK